MSGRQGVVRKSSALPQSPDSALGHWSSSCGAEEPLTRSLSALLRTSPGTSCRNSWVLREKTRTPSNSGTR